MRSLEEAVAPPEIVLRIPGRWKAPDALIRALPEGFTLDPGRLILPDGSAVDFCPLPRDGAFASVFAEACRSPLSTEVQRLLRTYRINACLAGPGGSLDAVERMFTAAVGLLRAGGAGVFIDNSVLAHERRVWLDLGSGSDPEAAVPAFVNFIRSPDELWSIGMHTLGLPDARIGRSGGDDADSGTLVEFLHYACRFPHLIEPGDFIEDDRGVLRLSHTSCRRFHRGSPVHNPYGRWRLERVGMG